MKFHLLFGTRYLSLGLYGEFLLACVVLFRYPSIVSSLTPSFWRKCARRI